jgi:hypothetical protein
VTAFKDTDVFAKHGGMAGMGAGLAEGMVLVMSLWDDQLASTSEGSPEEMSQLPRAAPGVVEEALVG